MVIGKFYTEGFAAHISETFESMGYEVVRHEVGPRRKIYRNALEMRLAQAKDQIAQLADQVPRIRRFATERLLASGQGRPIGLSIVCHDFLQPAEVASLKEKTGAPAVMWFPDAITGVGRSYFLSAPYDALFFKDPFIVYNLRRTMMNRAIFYLPECCNPRYHKPVPVAPEDFSRYGCDIATAGNMYPYRAEFFRNLIGYDVKIWGNPAPAWLDVSAIKGMIQNRFVANEEKSKAFLCAKIVLNNLNPAEIWGVNVRTFEIAAAGGFQCVDWRPGLSQLFVEGKEIVAFRDIDDLKRKLDLFLRNDDQRREIAHSSQQRAHKDHTYERRLALLMATVFEGRKGYPFPEIGWR